MVFRSDGVVVFCDGDFWHGKDWAERRNALARGANAEYWIGKIEGNMERDRRNNEVLRSEGWTVLRFWESDILAGQAAGCGGTLRVAPPPVETAADVWLPAMDALPQWLEQHLPPSACTGNEEGS